MPGLFRILYNPYFVAIYATLFVGVSLVFRRFHNKYILRPKFANALFEERWTSGRSLRSIVTRLGGARNCIWIVVADGKLYVGPHFPFNLMFLPEIYGLEYEIPGQHITSAERIESRLAKSRVRISFRAGLIGEETFELLSKKPDQLLTALATIRAA